MTVPANTGKDECESAHRYVGRLISPANANVGNAAIPTVADNCVKKG